MELVYINIGVGSVFESQVVALLYDYYQKQYFSKITLVCGIRSDEELNKAKEILQKQQFQVIYFKTYPNYSFFLALQENSLYKAIRLVNFNKDEIVAHVRGELAALMAKKGFVKCGIPLKRVLVDIRGASRDEILEFQHKNKWLRKFKLMNVDKAIQHLPDFGAVSAVSKALKEYLELQLINGKINIDVIPCFASGSFLFNQNDRNTIRKELGIHDNQLLLVFATGGTALWQKNDVVQLLAEQGFKILNLSNKIINHSNVISRFVPYSKVAAYLSASDAAIIFRDKSIVNKVASPVKFSEYVCSGLPVISNGTVDVIEQFLIQYEAGMKVNSIQELSLSSIKKFDRSERDAISAAGIKMFGSQLIISKYLDIYNKMIKAT